MLLSLLSWPWRMLRNVATGGSAAKAKAAAEARAALEEELRQEHDALCAKVSGEVGEVLSETERATLAVGDHLNRIVNDAREFIGQVREDVGSLDSDEGEGVSAQLERQAHKVTEFLEELRSVICMQREAAARVQRVADEVATATESVSAITCAARVLCLNTMVEAARLGDAGHPMIVIGDNMRGLSEQIAETNVRISESIAELRPTLLDVDKSTESAAQRTTEFRAEFEREATEVGAVADHLRTMACSILGAADTKVAAIVDCSGNAIQGLQTQDIISQRLRHAVKLLGAGVENVPTRVSAAPDPVGPVGPVASSAPVAPVATSAVAPVNESDASPANADPSKPANTSASDVYLSNSLASGEERELEAGDVMMF
ncbi:MAG: hypothetical protein AB8H80_17920 [Planctomycetota bacterium]